MIHIANNFFACKDTQTNSTNEIVFPQSNVSFSKHVEPLLQQKCAIALCHAGNNPAKGLNLEYNSFNSLRNRPGLIIGGDSKNSTLVLHLEGVFTPMPPARFPQLTKEQIEGIKKWIDEGAVNN